ESADIALLHRWHNEPHVKAWYDRDLDLSTPESVAEIYASEDQSHTQGYIVLWGGAPIGYIQTYRIRDYPYYSRHLDLDEDAAGVDLFIGEAGYIHKGFSAHILRGFLAAVVFARPGTSSCVVGPEPANKAAIRAYEKAGFRYLKTVQIPGEPEPEELMGITIEEFVAPPDSSRRESSSNPAH
ncbi:MAG TPA: GNAT family N-acetyltransferase, partial [Bryobacteraceae bacterium]|nr:GNAT family N-acetyltransferase [Bryobacteraceae bacterium]